MKFLPSCFCFIPHSNFLCRIAFPRSSIISLIFIVNYVIFPKLMLPSSTYVQSNVFFGIYIIYFLRSILFFQLPSGINITSLEKMLKFFSSLFLEITSGRTILCWHWVLKIKSHPRWCMRSKSAIQRTCSLLDNKLMIRQRFSWDEPETHP